MEEARPLSTVEFVLRKHVSTKDSTTHYLAVIYVEIKGKIHWFFHVTANCQVKKKKKSGSWCRMGFEHCNTHDKLDIATEYFRNIFCSASYCLPMVDLGNLYRHHTLLIWQLLPHGMNKRPLKDFQITEELDRLDSPMSS